MAPPLVKGTRTGTPARRGPGLPAGRVALLVSLSIAMYQKKFTDIARVSLETDRAGNQLSVHADVKVRGLIVGEVRKINSRRRPRDAGPGDEAGEAATTSRPTCRRGCSPRRCSARRRSASSSRPTRRRSGSRPATPSRRTGRAPRSRPRQALNNLLPLLQALKPERLSVTLNALSEALRGRGDRLGQQLRRERCLLPAVQPLAAAAGARTWRGSRRSPSDYAETTPDLLRTLDNFSFSSRSLVQERAAARRVPAQHQGLRRQRAEHRRPERAPAHRPRQRQRAGRSSCSRPTPTTTPAC